MPKQIFRGMTNYHYLNLYWRTGIALIASLIILFIGQPLHFDVAFTSPKFYRALAFSSVTTIGMMYIVQFVSIRLDRRAPWRKVPLRRTALQLIFGFLPALLFDIIASKIYYGVIAKDIIKRGGHFDLVFAAIFLLGWNALYFGLKMRHLLRRQEAELQIVQKRIDTIDESEQLAQLEVKFEGGIIRFDVREEILYFFRDNRKVMAMTVTGRTYIIQDTLSTLAARFAPVDFCQINPSVIINLATLQGYGQWPSRERLRVIFREEYQTVIDPPRDKKYRVTKDHIEPFLHHFKGKKVSDA